MDKNKAYDILNPECYYQYQVFRIGRKYNSTLMACGKDLNELINNHKNLKKDVYFIIDQKSMKVVWYNVLKNHEQKDK